MAAVEFTETFNVEETKQTSDWVNYRNFIEPLRKRLGVRFSHNRPVLPPQVNPPKLPTKFFDILLQTKSRNQFKLRIRRDNLYLVGYQMNNSAQWLEFGSDTTKPTPPHLIPRSKFLGFGGEYGSLDNAAGKDQGRKTLILGQEQLTTAVNDLATSANKQVRAKSLIIVIQMISESIRFIYISNRLATKYRPSPTDKEKQAQPPDALMLAYENGWGQLSAALLKADADPVYGFRLPQPNAMNIRTAAQAVAVIGILLDSTSTASGRLLLMATNEDGQYFPQGQPLVEVFSVRIEGENHLYGAITVTDGLGSQYIYNRKREDCESICKPGDAASLLLTGPARSISAYGSFTINVALMDKDDELSSPDEQMISWNVFNTSNEYDKPLFDKVDGGKYGSATVNYVVLSDAVEATVEVTLIKRDGGEDPANVYGQITARNENFMNNESVLFRKTSEEKDHVSHGQLVPLSRSVVAVPLNSSLIVQANLYANPSSEDHEIADGNAEFPAQLSGASEKNISGKYGEIQVKVTWTN